MYNRFTLVIDKQIDSLRKGQRREPHLSRKATRYYKGNPALLKKWENEYVSLDAYHSGITECKSTVSTIPKDAGMTDKDVRCNHRTTERKSNF